MFHAGDGNLHPLILFDANDADQLHRCELFGADILETSVAMGGTVTGEHGVGVEKLNSMCVQFSAEENAQMFGIKHAFDTRETAQPRQGHPHPAPLRGVRQDAGARRADQAPGLAAVLSAMGNSTQGLRGLAWLLVLQTAGELLARAFSLPFPGPVVGMILLLVALRWPLVREPVAACADYLLQHLSLLFVPVGVGVMTHLALLSQYGGRMLRRHRAVDLDRAGRDGAGAVQAHARGRNPCG